VFFVHIISIFVLLQSCLGLQTKGNQNPCQLARPNKVGPNRTALNSNEMSPHDVHDHHLLCPLKVHNDNIYGAKCCSDGKAK